MAEVGNEASQVGSEIGFGDAARFNRLDELGGRGDASDQCV